ncbi:hypothetical protein G6O67_005178 [Ophiocordyceps sinensis]|uniref:BZIP domain-containing protein n=2 Tax=Ophiocordyceps sinensis TaxID=72228 RepID=A0A8H4V5M6_9HYPO|nr:Basic-Leucine zipper transcription factor [Ophiocordyceps sinensis CO18]KAF4508847.1 hypothetical protein G6O67_005178 [Ophiocordyceps sinensis]
MNDHPRQHFNNDIHPARADGRALHASQLSATCAFEPGQGFLDHEALHNTIFCCPESNNAFSWIEQSFMEASDHHSLLRGPIDVGKEFANAIDASRHWGPDSDSKDSASLDSLPISPKTPRKGRARPSESTATPQRARSPKRKCLEGNSTEAAKDSGVPQAREKNRIAADKCRSKKRRAVAQLKTKHESLESTHRQLSSTASDLVAETHALKNMLMQHGNCDCELIQKYLKDAAFSWIAKKTDEHLEA